MVRNTKGGSSHKKMASKNAKMNLGYRKLRKVKEEGEDYPNGDSHTCGI